MDDETRARKPAARRHQTDRNLGMPVTDSSRDTGKKTGKPAKADKSKVAAVLVTPVTAGAKGMDKKSGKKGKGSVSSKPKKHVSLRVAAMQAAASPRCPGRPRAVPPGRRCRAAPTRSIPTPSRR